MLRIGGVEIARGSVKHQREPPALDGDEPAIITPLGCACVRLGQSRRLRLAERERGIDDLGATVHYAHEQRGTFRCSLRDRNLNLSFRCRGHVDASLALCAVQLPYKVELA